VILNTDGKNMQIDGFDSGIFMVGNKDELKVKCIENKK
jgi:hypothetical protein